ncbi:MAG: NAD-dependent epimerase/dehydratase family protein [Planctomycetes bacterium]|nr:NAD-dependent epimerase/dehydratase family protein [Planctomycetota bacterium]
MKVLVTGATGFLGSHLCRRLVNDGYDVSVLPRASSHKDAIEGLNLTEIIGDVTDRDSLDQAVKGQDIVVHAAAHVLCWRQLKDLQNHINICGTRNIVEACRKHSVKRLIQISSIAAIGIPSTSEAPIDETFHFNLLESGLNYHISKYLAEKEVISGVQQGLDAVIINPSSIFGPFLGKYRGSQMIEKVKQNRIVLHFRGGLTPVHVSDVVDGIIQTIKKGEKGQRYILGGENLTYRKMLVTAAEFLGLKRNFVTIPALATRLAAMVLEPLGCLIRKHPPMTWDLHYSANRFLFYNSTKAKKKLRYNPRPFVEIVKEYFSGNYE